MARCRKKRGTPTRRRPPGLDLGTHFLEDYRVKINRRKPDGYWVIGEVVTVKVPLRWGEPEKVNHDRAEALARKRYPGCEIVRVTYL